MDSFYLIVACIAIILLILLLTVIGIMMSNQNKLDAYPPYHSQCPDYWGVNSNGTCSTMPDSSGLNTLPNGYNQDDAKEKARLKKIKVTASGSTLLFDFSGNKLCDNKEWANSRNIEWDGVSNSATCPTK
jgi:hypothetical protein